MTKRPENVRCENCCYWDRSICAELSEHTDKTEAEQGIPAGSLRLGGCFRHPPRSHWISEEGDDCGHSVPYVFAMWWCGEFRAEWPAEGGQ